MYINEYGNPNDPKLILLAPMMVSGSDLYDLLSPYLKGKYFIIAPDQGGHGKAGAYIGADEEYKQLKEYLQNKDYTDIKLVYGAFLGVAVGWRLFMEIAGICGYSNASKFSAAFRKCSGVAPSEWKRNLRQ